MPTIKITTDRQPWANGQPQPKGAEIDVPLHEAEALTNNGFAELVADVDAPAAKTTTRRRRTEDEAAS